MQGEDKDYERLSVIRQLLDGKQESLSKMDQDILSLCEVTSIDKEIEESEEFTASIICLKFEQSKHANSATRGFVSNDNITSESKCSSYEITEVVPSEV